MEQGRQLETVLGEEPQQGILSQVRPRSCSLRKAECGLGVVCPPWGVGSGPRALEAGELCSGLLSPHLHQGGPVLGQQGHCEPIPGIRGVRAVGKAAPT